MPHPAIVSAHTVDLIRLTTTFAKVFYSGLKAFNWSSATDGAILYKYYRWNWNPEITGLFLDFLWKEPRPWKYTFKGKKWPWTFRQYASRGSFYRPLSVGKRRDKTFLDLHGIMNTMRMFTVSLFESCVHLRISFYVHIFQNLQPWLFQENMPKKWVSTYRSRWVPQCSGQSAWERWSRQWRWGHKNPSRSSYWRRTPPEWCLARRILPANNVQKMINCFLWFLCFLCIRWRGIYL